MLRRIWEMIVSWFRHLFGKPTSNRGNANINLFKVEQTDIKPQPILEDADYEYLFMQLLEGVAHGWQQDRVLKFFQALGDRGKPELWVPWLQRFGGRLLASSSPNNELASRMVQMGELHGGAIGNVSQEIGMQLLTRHQYDQMPQQVGESSLYEYDGEDLATEVSQPPSDVKTVTLDELLVMLQQDADLVQQLAAQMGINTTEPQVIIETLISQFNATAETATE